MSCVEAVGSPLSGWLWAVTLSGWWLAVAMRGGLTIFAWRRETHTTKERDMSHGGKNGIINNK